MANKAEKLEDKKIDHIDPVTGEIIEHVEGGRYRRRDDFIDDLGREIPDPRPMQPPIGYKKQPSMFELIREATAREVALYAANREPESLEESEDFDVDDDYDPTSPWENDFDPPWSEVRQAIAEAREKRAAAPPAQPAGQPLQSPPAPQPPSGRPDPDPIA